MKRWIFPVILTVVLATAAYASCKVGELAWSYSVNTSKPRVFNATVKGAVQNNGKTTVSSAVVKISVYRKADNTKAASMSATVESIAPGAKASFVAGPAMVVPSGTKVDSVYYYKVDSCTER